jgi:hypothetical protein
MILARKSRILSTVDAMLALQAPPAAIHTGVPALHCSLSLAITEPPIVAAELLLPLDSTKA